MDCHNADFSGALAGIRHTSPTVCPCGYNYPVTTPIIIGSLHLVLIAIHTLSRYSTTSFLNARNSSDAACCLKDGPPSPNG